MDTLTIGRIRNAVDSWTAPARACLGSLGESGGQADRESRGRFEILRPRAHPGSRAVPPHVRPLRRRIVGDGHVQVIYSKRVHRRIADEAPVGNRSPVVPTRAAM